MIDESKYKSIAFSRNGRVLSICLNRPKSLNVINHELHEELSNVFYDAAEEPDSDVIVLTGSGAAFCAGGDLLWLQDQVRGEKTAFVRESHAARRIAHGILDCQKPTIARVNGDAIGLGASIALLCDIVIAVESARFIDPHVKVGLSAGDGGAMIWPQLIGFAKAKHYLFTGEAMNARDAERCGLISFAVDAEAFDTFVADYASKLANGAQVAIRYTKTTVNIALKQLLNSVFEVGLAYEGLTQRSLDHQEGLAAFLERRKPIFKGN